ncbi:MAG: hypothetical protein J0M02_02335 [Planctomycetes bacterium]|nr:hypothetical protein [Planctomycetota bacterium]
MTWIARLLSSTAAVLMILLSAGCGSSSDPGTTSSDDGGGGGTSPGDLASIADTYHRVSGTVSRGGTDHTFTLHIAHADAGATMLGWYTEMDGATTVANHAAFGVYSAAAWHMVVSEKTTSTYGPSSNLIHFTATNDLLGTAGTSVAISNAAVKSGLGVPVTMTFSAVTVAVREAWSTQSLGGIALVDTDANDTGTTFTAGLDADWELIKLTITGTGPSYSTEAHWLTDDTDQWEQAVDSTRTDAASETATGYFFSDADGKRAFVGMRTTASGGIELAAFTVRSDSAGRRRFGGYFLNIATDAMSTSYYLAAVAASG